MQLVFVRGDEKAEVGSLDHVPRIGEAIEFDEKIRSDTGWPTWARVVDVRWLVPPYGATAEIEIEF
ncbi:MAG: hypothetical protein ABSF89_18570 [Acidimicrobiales bacterium]|jgi:hypothetical protein